MALPASPGPTTAAKSVLACVPCAKSKARCDRKVPCTRCVRKKLNCQSRVSRRSARRLSLANGPHPDVTGGPTPHLDAAVNGTNGNSNGTQETRETTHGIWMDWSHRFDARLPSRTVDCPTDPRPAEVALKDDFLTQLVAAAVSGADESYPPLSSAKARLDHSSIAPFMGPPGDDLLDLFAHSPPPPPTPQMLLDPGEDTAFLFSTSAPIPFSGGNGDAMDHYSPVVPRPMSDAEPNYYASSDSNTDQVEALEGWPLFRCNPVTPSSAHQFNAAAHVKNLYALLKNRNYGVASEGRPSRSNAPIEPLLATTREKMTAILQGLFSEAQQLYDLRGQDHGLHVLTMLAPSEMDFLFRAYRDCCEPHYPLMPLASLGINEYIQSSYTILPSIRLLLITAVGALTAGAGTGYPEIALGLVDICRTALRRLVEQNIKLTSDPDVALCAWLLVLATVWSGNKWHMDLGLFQKAMYLEMHLKSGVHEPREEQLARLDSSNGGAQRWELWKTQERLNRSTYSWLILDYEICLFQDIPSTTFLSVVNLDLPIPSPDATLTSPTAKHWAQEAGVLSTAGRQTISIPPTLREWVQCFTSTNDISTMTHVSPTTLRLLLCHLMDQVLQLRSRIDSILTSNHHHHSKTSRQSSTVLLSVQVSEVQELLQKWFDVSQTRCPGDTPANCANMMLYHLIMLNTMASVPEIERLAREGGGKPPSPSHNHNPKSTNPSSSSFSTTSLSSLPKTLATPVPTGRQPRPAHAGRAYHLDLEDAHDIYFHCGQALRNSRLIPESSRPPWWAGVVYRVALVAWGNSMARRDERGDDGGSIILSRPWHGHAHGGRGELRIQADTDGVQANMPVPLRLDALPPGDERVVAYLDHRSGAGSPVFSSLDAGSGGGGGGTVSLADPVGVLRHCAGLLESEGKTRFTKGIQMKLMAMARRWEGVGP